MRLYDILKMATHNLWQRRGRTALNLIGVVVGCIVLLMTFAGVSGVKHAVHLLFDSTEAARQIGVYGGRSSEEPPPEALVVEGEMSDERRERLQARLADRWEDDHRLPSDWMLTGERLEVMAGLKHVLSVVPEVSVPCTVRVDDPAAGSELTSEVEIAESIAAVGLQNGLVAARVIAGRMPKESAPTEVLVKEFVAYQLGYRDDDQLEELVGKQLVVSYHAADGGVAGLKGIFAQQLQGLSALPLQTQFDLMATFAQLANDLDTTSLSDEQKELVRSLLRGEMPDDDADDPDADEPVAVGDQLAGEPKGPPVIETRLRVCGVLRSGNDDRLSQIFNAHWFGRRGTLFVAPSLAMQIHSQAEEHSQAEGQPVYRGASVTIDSTQHLSDVIESLEQQGAGTMSALHVLEEIDEQIDHSGWLVLAIAAAILLTAAIGISNTLWISVLERTPEFGILKSVGATDSTLVLLMVCEGALLGFVGAVAAIALSLVLGTLGSGLLQVYLESRINHDVTSGLFHFSLLSMLAVVALSVAVCIVASILPAWRAGRLDPVVALRRT